MICVYYIYILYILGIYILYRCGRGSGHRDVPIIHRRREGVQIYIYFF